MQSSPVLVFPNGKDRCLGIAIEAKLYFRAGSLQVNDVKVSMWKVEQHSRKKE